jgi:hypothetical protein
MAQAEQVLHAYRRILRATTYVPDSFARAYVHDFIASRFKANCTVNPDRPNADALLANRLKKTRSWTRILESAADGNLEDLNKVLLRVHGRQGARKRILIRQLLQPDEDLLPKDDKALEELIHKPTTESTLGFKPGTKLHALARSQQEHHPREHIKAKLRHLDPRVPKENIWGRPTPRKLANNLTKKWWAATIDKLLPPITRSEWERLRDLATGGIPLEEAPARRPRGTILPADQTVDTQLSGELLLNALRSPARPTQVGIQKLEFDASQGLKIVDTADPSKRSLVKSSPRAIRRMYAGLWILTPIMRQEEVTIRDQVRKQWVVQWGEYRSPALNGAISKPTIRDQELFEGIDSYPNDNQAAALEYLHQRNVARAERKRIREEEARAREEQRRAEYRERREKRQAREEQEQRQAF